MSCVVPGCQFTKNTTEKISMHLFPDPSREPQRHLNWIKVINCERIFKFDPYVVFKRFRVCRNHFTSECFNGQCKKLLPTAVPSLFLSASNPERLKTKYQIYKQKIIALLKNNAVNVEDDSLKLINIDDSQSHAHLLKLPDSEIKIQYDSDKLWTSTEEEQEEFVLMEVVNSQDSQEENQSFTIVLPPQESIQNTPKVLNYQKSAPKAISSNNAAKKSVTKQKLAIQPLSKPKLNFFQVSFAKCPRNLLARNICTKANPFEVLTSYCESDFSHKIDLKIKADVKREWCHAAFKLIRLPFMNHFKLDDFEFSQAHFCYWDTIERSYFFLNSIVETSEQSIESQLLTLLLDNPLNVGRGNWIMFSNIISKHGLMPEECFPQPPNHQPRLNAVLQSKLREYAKILRDMSSSSKCSSNEIQIKIDEQMSEVHSIIGILFGIAPEKFTWKYTDKSRKACSLGPTTPIEFYEQYVKPYFNVDNREILTADSRSTLTHGKMYCANFVGNVVGGKQTIFNNQPIDALIDFVTKSIVNEEAAVLASCNVSGINDFQLQNIKHLCDVKILSNLEKPDRITYRDYCQKKSMIISAVEIDRSGKLLKLRLESFDENESRFLSIPKENLSAIISDVVIDKKLLPPADAKDPVCLDPLDALSCIAM